MRTYTDETIGITKIMLTEAIFSILVGIIATVIVMYLHNDSIICTEYYCYAHRHSVYCYLGWSGINGVATYIIWTIILMITRYPLFYNIFGVWLYNVLHFSSNYSARKSNIKKNTMKEFLNYEKSRLIR